MYLYLLISYTILQIVWVIVQDSNIYYIDLNVYWLWSIFDDDM